MTTDYAVAVTPEQSAEQEVIATPRAPAIPKSLTDLLADVVAAGWAHVINHNEDHSGNPFISVEFGRLNPTRVYQITWHTRATNGASYRLFSKMDRYVPGDGRGYGWQDSPSLKAIREIVRTNPVTQDEDKPGVRGAKPAKAPEALAPLPEGGLEIRSTGMVGRVLRAVPSACQPARCTDLSLIFLHEEEVTLSLAVTLDEENTAGIVAWLGDVDSPDFLTVTGDVHVLALLKHAHSVTGEILLDVTIRPTDQRSAQGVTVFLDAGDLERLRTWLQSRV